MHRIATVVLMLAALAAPAQVALAAAPGERFERAAARLVEVVNSGDYAKVTQDFAPIMLDALPPAKAEEFFRGVTAQCGRITKVGPAAVKGPMGVMPLDFDRGRMDLKLVLDDDGRITGLWVVPHQPPLPVPERNTTPLRLPVGGRWRVVWGGDTTEQNYHVSTPSQRRAVDLVVVDGDGRSHRGEGKANEDYYCWDKPLAAPADGVVVEAIDGVRDNVPGDMNPFSAVGNCVVIRHSEHEVSVLAHFRRGTVAVKAGDKVKAGQTLGRCGNSGNSSEPHLHYHLMNTDVFGDATGIAPHFKRLRVTRDGKAEVLDNHMPVRGEQVEAVE
jgi:hypothetical protein